MGDGRFLMSKVPLYVSLRRPLPSEEGTSQKVAQDLDLKAEAKIWP